MAPSYYKFTISSWLRRRQQPATSPKNELFAVAHELRDKLHTHTWAWYVCIIRSTSIRFEIFRMKFIFCCSSVLFRARERHFTKFIPNIHHSRTFPKNFTYFRCLEQWKRQVPIQHTPVECIYIIKKKKENVIEFGVPEVKGICIQGRILIAADSDPMENWISLVVRNGHQISHPPPIANTGIIWSNELCTCEFILVFYFWSLQTENSTGYWNSVPQLKEEVTKEMRNLVHFIIFYCRLSSSKVEIIIISFHTGNEVIDKR